MKNWNKTVSTPNYDILVQKHYDPDQEDTPYFLDVVLNIHGCLNKVKFQFSSEGELDKAYDMVDEQEAINVAKGVLKMHGEEF